MNLGIYNRGPFWRYGVAVLAVALAVLIRHMLTPLIGLHAEYVTIFPAILIVAVLAGRNPAILTGVLGGPAVALLSRSVLSPHVFLEIIFVVGTAVLAGWLVQKLHNARAADRQILESIPGMIFTTRADGYCDYQSQQWVDYTGVPGEKHLGDGWSTLLHPEDRPRALAAWRSAVHDRTSYDIEYRVRRADGQYEWFKVRGRPIRNAAGRVVRWFGVAVNIDAFRHSQEELQTQKKELEAIIHIVSHDLRAPLLNIRGFSDILKDDCTTVHELLDSECITEPARKRLDAVFAQSAPEALAIIDTSARAMSRLVDSLVKVARAGLVIPKPEALDMNQLVKEVVTSIRMKFDTTGTAIDISDLPACFADRTHVTQVFTNLIDNAIKYLDPARRAQICVEGMIEKDNALYWVSDTGVGVAAEDEQKVFEIFYRVDDKSGTGEGIGLSIVKRMVERNGGRIWLVSEPGRGSNFFVALPLPPATAYDQLQSAPVASTA